MGYLPQYALENLKKYHYRGVDNSVLSHLILNKYWAWIVTFWPLSVAPNTITLSGLLVVFLNFLTLLYYDPMYLTEKHGGHGPPNWMYFTWGIGLFVYQSFDAVDGKQARRTGMASPLGQLFDHGCDALNTTLEVVLCCYALNLGRSWWTVSSQVATLANFYLTTWEEYHTGVLFLSYISGPVEGIIIIIGVYFVTGFMGPTFWDQGILSTTGLRHFSLFDKLPDVPMNESFMIFAAVGLGMNIIHGYINVRQAAHGHGHGRKDSCTSSPLLLLLPFVFPTLVQIAWLSHPRFNDSWIIGSAAFVPFLCAWGLQFSHQVGRMILAHVTGEPFPVWDWIWVWSILGALDANLPVFGLHPIVQTSSKRSTIVVWVTLVISLVSERKVAVDGGEKLRNKVGSVAGCRGSELATPIAHSWRPLRSALTFLALGGEGSEKPCREICSGS